MIDCHNGCRFRVDDEGVIWVVRQCAAHEAESDRGDRGVRDAYDYELDARMSEILRGRKLESPRGGSLGDTRAARRT